MIPSWAFGWSATEVPLFLDALKPGDLVFRYRGETGFAAAVSAVVPGWGGLEVYHVGLYEGSGWVWEAGHEGVRRVAVSSWEGGLLGAQLHRRWELRHPGLISRALSWVATKQGYPYNATFDQSKMSFYCSELVIDAFREAGVPVFFESPLRFSDPATGVTVPFWAQYYADRGLAVPEGQPGSHPATLSLSPELHVERLTLSP